MKLASLDQQEATESLAESQGDIRWRNTSRGMSTFWFQQKHRLKKCLPISLRVLLPYLRNLRQRIAEEQKIYLEGWRPQCISLRGVDKYAHVCIRDMTRLEERFPFLTYFERLIAVLAWHDGTECGENNAYTQLRRNTSSASPEIDSRPHQEAQQGSIHDLLSQLPSQVLRDELARRDKSCTTQKIESQPPGDSQISSSNYSSSE